MKPLSLIAWLLLGLLAPLFAADYARADAAKELEASQQRLAEIQQQIEKSLRELRAKRSEAGGLADELARLERELRKLEAALARSQAELQQVESDIARLQDEIRQAEQARAETQSKLKERLAVLYKSGQVGLAKVLLGTTAGPREIAENHYYLNRMIRHDRQLVAEYRQRAAELAAKLAELEQLRRKQAATAERRRREQAVLAEAGRQKRALLAELRSDQTLLENYLAELRAKAARLEDLVKKLETEREPTYSASFGPFTDQKARLGWPVPGRLRVGFGPSRHAELGTRIESNGLEIAAATATPVKAVWGGKVLYASPFRGYGKLMIIDHGEQYYSLYAQVADFAKQVGEAVSPGEIVATTGFEGRDFLYFELRHKGKPIDPLPWLKPR